MIKIIKRILGLAELMCVDYYPLRWIIFACILLRIIHFIWVDLPHPKGKSITKNACYSHM